MSSTSLPSPRILIISRYYPPRFCGVGDHTVLLRAQLQAQGLDSWVLTQSDGDIDAAQRIYPVANWDMLSILHAIAWLKRHDQIDQVFWQYVPHIFYRKGLPLHLIPLFMAVRSLGLPQALFAHEVSQSSTQGRWVMRTWGKLQRWLGMTLAGLSDAVFTNNRQHQLKLAPFPTSLHPVGSNFTPAPVDFERKDPLQFFTFTARLKVETLHTLAKIDRSRYPWQLHIAGHDNSANPQQRQQELKIEAERLQLTKHLHWHGTQSVDQFTRLLQPCAIMLHTEPTGGGGISTKNGCISVGMQMGCAIVANHGEQTDRNFFRHQDNILLYDAEQDGSMLDCLQSLLNDPQAPQRIGQAAQRTYQQHMDWQVTGQRIAARLQHLQA